MKEDGSRNYRRTTFWWWCESCEFGQVDPMPSVQDLDDYYAFEYRKETHDHRAMGYEYDGEPGQWNYDEEEERARGWVDYIDHPVECHLDVGASTGKVLEVVGAEHQAGIETGPWSQYYESYPFIEDVDRKYDLVTCFHTLEHVCDPVELLRQIAHIATSQVCIEVPLNMRHWPHLLDFRNKSLLQAMGVAGLPAKIVEDAHHIKAKAEL